MPPLLRYLINRALSIPITLLVITAVLYASVMLTPAEERATLYLPKNLPSRMTDAQYQKLIDQIIQRYHLSDPYPVQYFFWITNLVQGNWGYSPTLQEDVLTAIVKRTPATAELTLYSILIFIPFGLISGVVAGSRQNQAPDHRFRLTAFIATSLPPFILALFLLAIFYVGLYWFAPERTSLAIGFIVKSDQFRQYTGLLTIDGLLNGRPEISLDAFRHLVLPVFTLAIAHWATLGRVTRATMIEEMQKDYVIAAKARGIPGRSIVWRHTLRNAIAPALTSSLLSAASLMTGVFVVEIIYNFHGISEIAVRSMEFTPDAPAALGFAIYSVIVVLILMFILDIIQSSMDPRIREGG
jgi:ABC-type dipeptide/oligopeptide/nickel transport system permease component